MPVLALQMDIRDPSAVSMALDRCEAKFGLPNIVINNAAGNFISVSNSCMLLILRFDGFTISNSTLLATPHGET